MKSTILNRAELEKTHFDCENLKDLMASIEDLMQTRGEVVCQYVVNGMALQEADEKRLSETRIEEIETIEVKSEQPTALLFEILKNWELEIPRIIEQTDALAGSIRLRGPDGQYTAFVNLIDSCQFLIESLVSMDSVIETDPYMPREGWLASEKEMASAIGLALESFEKKDHAMLADTLEYDLANSLQSWFDLLKGLNANLQEENDRDSGALTHRIFKKSGESQSDSLDREASLESGRDS